jgi:fatty-acyl-CoA synthase
LFIGAPAHFLFMSQLPDFETVTFPDHLLACIAASPVPEPQLRQWESRGLPLQQAYGMTETCGVVMALDPADRVRKAGSAGKACLHAAFRIVRVDGTEAAVGEMGELWVKGPSVTPGYWKNDEANRTAFSDGWLHTGDAALIDDEGYYYIVDRWKDMYITGGENVYPAEVEEVLFKLDGIAEAAIIGVPDPRWGEVGRAIISLKPGRVVTEAEIMRHCDANLARYKQPRSVRFVDALPRNATGKVHKPTLRRLHGDT